MFSFLPPGRIPTLGWGGVCVCGGESGGEEAAPNANETTAGTGL